jgi:hypothetical protein
MKPLIRNLEVVERERRKKKEGKKGEELIQSLMSRSLWAREGEWVGG